MAEVRKDSKGRRLFNGESQRKDGKYEYKYIDVMGQRKTVYSWKLTKADSVPKEKKDDISLREKEKKIRKNLDMGISLDGDSITVSELVEKYLELKTGIGITTKQNYTYTLRKLKEDYFGMRKISTIKTLDAKKWVYKLQEENGWTYNYISEVCTIIRPAFQMAVDEDILIKNPFNFRLRDVLVNNSSKRDSLTEEEEALFLEFIKNDKVCSKRYDGIFILFKTGMRISEFAGLTINDLDFIHNRIIIDHQLVKLQNGTNKIVKPKTESGKRIIPMTLEVKEAFLRILEKRNSPKVEPVVDGYSGFLFITSKGSPLVANHWQGYFRSICNKYNKTHEVSLPPVTPHVCRHTFCSNMAKKGMNVKALQYIMGHSNISVTLNVYTHLKYMDAEKEMLEILNLPE